MLLFIHIPSEACSPFTMGGQLPGQGCQQRLTCHFQLEVGNRGNCKWGPWNFEVAKVAQTAADICAASPIPTWSHKFSQTATPCKGIVVASPLAALAYFQGALSYPPYMWAETKKKTISSSLSMVLKETTKLPPRGWRLLSQTSCCCRVKNSSLYYYTPLHQPATAAKLISPLETIKSKILLIAGWDIIISFAAWST